MGSPVVAASPRKSPLSGRRLNKPLVEKKRRARINGCLGQLKSLILSAMQSEQGSQVSRLEKADILEMTVKYLRHVQRHQASAAAGSEPEVVAKFSAGYTECATEVIRYMDSVQCVAPEVRSRLECHLVERLRGSVPNNAAATTAGGCTPVPAFSGISVSNQTSVNDVCGMLMSSSSNIPEEIHRHYQTAVDLANMAAAVTAKESAKPTAGVGTTTALTQPQSFHRPHSISELSLVGAAPSGVHPAFSMVLPSKCITSNEMYHRNDRYHSKSADIVRSHSISPSHIALNEIPVPMATSTPGACHDGHVRHRSEPGVSQIVYSLTTNRNVSEELNTCVNNDVNNNYNVNKFVPNPAGTTNINEYLSSFQRPLHIHIPDSVATRPSEPTPSPPFLPDSPSPLPLQPTPSPPFLHPHVGYPHAHVQSHPPTTVASRADATHDIPQTVFYGYSDYHTDVPNNHGIDLTHMYHSQYTSHTIGGNIQTRAMNNNNSYNECLISESTDGTQSQAGNNFSKNYLGTISSYHTDFQGHNGLPRGKRTTPSPPTLLPEEDYVSDPSDQYSSTSYHNVSNQEYSQDLSANSDFRTGFPAILSPNFKENYDPQSIKSSSQMNHNVQYSCNQYDQLPGYSIQRQSNLTSTSAIKQTRHCPAEHSPGSGLRDNGQGGMKGPCQNPSAPSRQNNLPLSPPTLKKRLLLAQGSEGEWATPRCSRENGDKRAIQHDTGRVHSSERGANPRLWADGHETPVQLSRETMTRLPATLFCSGPVQGVSADDGLWRPW